MAFKIFPGFDPPPERSNYIVSWRLLLMGRLVIMWLHGLVDGYRATSWDPWTWADGSLFSFENWASNEPDGSGNCLKVDPYKNWADYDCNYKRLGICAIRVEEPPPPINSSKSFFLVPLIF